MDRQLGTMDITYSAAWQLGRTLAIADQAFTAALVRLRGEIQTVARRETKKETAPPGTAKSKAQTLRSIQKSVATFAALGAAPAGKVPSDPASRFRKIELPAPRFALEKQAGSSPPDAVRSTVFASKVMKTSTQLASATDTTQPDTGGPVDDNTGEEVYVPFNEINVPKSSD